MKGTIHMKLIEAIIGLAAGGAAIFGYNKLTSKKDEQPTVSGESTGSTTVETTAEEVKVEVPTENTEA
jgi:hypothetical protein